MSYEAQKSGGLLKTLLRMTDFNQLPTPVKYEDFNKENKSALSTIEIFDGFRFEISKNLAESPEFGVSHALAMGSVMEPASYNFATAVTVGKQPFQTSLSGRIDTDGHLMGRLQQELGNKLTLRVSGQASPEPHNSAAHVELDWKGSHWYGNFKWGNPGIYGISYMQSVSPSLSLGMETIYHHKQAMSLLTLGGRYDTKQYIATGLVTAGHFSASYTHKISDRVNLATEFTASWPTGTLETLYSVGFEYSLRTSHLKAHVDSNGKVSAIVEEMMNQATRIAVCAELDHKKKNYRFGFGVSMAL